MHNTKYGRQPFLDLLIKAGKTYGGAADEMGVSYRHLRHVGYGQVRPKYELRDGLMALLGVGLDKLFTEEILASPPHYGERGRALINETREQAKARLARERAEKMARRESKDLPEAS